MQKRTDRTGAAAREVLGAFPRLELTSFGGPVAHPGRFRTEFAERRRRLTDAACADLVALRQLLTGPASSRFGVGLGEMRAGWAGAQAALVGFTLSSALVMLACAARAGWMTGPLAVVAFGGAGGIGLALSA